MKTLLALFVTMTCSSLALAGPTQEDYSKLIVGRWLGQRDYEIYYPDGTWAVQRNGDDKPEKKGRHWHIEGNKLTLNFPDGTSSETIVSMDQSRFVTKDNGMEDVRTKQKNR